MGVCFVCWWGFLLVVFTELAGWSFGFSPIAPRSAHVMLMIHHQPSTFLASHSEFSMIDPDMNPGDEDAVVSSRTSDYVVVNQNEQQQQQVAAVAEDANGSSTSTTRPEYGAMSPGTVVQVQIGDLSLARKAWKKRRRTGSPLLVPCSILNADQRSMVRWNLIFLLEKFGKAQADGIQITASELSKRYRTFLRSSLQKQSLALGYESSQDMITELFNKKVQESYGIRLVEMNNKDGELALKAPMSRTKAQKRAAQTPILQFREPKPGDRGNDCDLSETLTHTGFLRTRKAQQDTTVDRSYHFLPLSAALRVSQKDDVDTGRIEEGSIHAAVVFDYDLTGDAGSPLLTLSLNPNGIRENLKVKPDRKFEPIETPKLVFQNLKVGDGPYRAKVVRLQHGRALVDMDVGRTLVSAEGTMVRCLGTLRYLDSVEVAGGNNNKNKMAVNKYDIVDEDDDEDFDEYEDDFGSDVDDVLFNFDDIDDDDDDDDDEDIEEDDNEFVADDLLSLRSSDTFAKGTFEDGEEEEDISDLFQINEDGNLAYTDPETGETTIMEASDDDDDDEEEEEEEEEEYVDEDNQDSTLDGDDDSDDIDFDMSSLFKEGEDGTTVAFIDPESGEALEVDRNDEEFEDMLTIKSLIDKYSRPPTPRNVDYIYSEEEDEELTKEIPVAATKIETKPNIYKPAPRLVSKRLRVGEEVNVYIRTVSKQSGQFTVTTNPTVQGRKAKDLKKESSATKKLDRLKKSLGGSLRKIWELEGQECGGVVKATSHTGEWVYVQPELSGLPVGVATMVQGMDQTLVAGDNVRVRIMGVDEQRGQLSMHLLSKLGP